MMLRTVIGMAALALVLACTGRQGEPQPPAGGDRTQQDGDGAAGAQQPQDEATIRRLEEEARALARTDGCASAGQCAAAPVGAKACGGPRGYVAYCTLTTDTAALHAKLAELERVEREYNARHQIVSDCMLVVEPPLALEGGRCVARQ